MNANDLYKSFDAVDDDTLANSETDRTRGNRLVKWISAAAAAMVLGFGIFAISHIIKSSGDDPHVVKPTEQTTDDPGSLAAAFAEIFKNAVLLPSADRIMFDGGLESWKAFYDNKGIPYSAVEGEVISTRYYLYWLNDEHGRSVAWGAAVSEVMLGSVPAELNKLGLAAGETVYVYDSVEMVPADNDCFRLMSAKTGKNITCVEDLEDVESFLFEITADDLVNYSFEPIVRDDTLPKEIGRKYYMLVVRSSGEAGSRLGNAYEQLLYCAVSVPTDETLGSLHAAYGFRFDQDIVLISEELSRIF
ncbi:MAG: hypothetical protein J5586_03485 [Clostridia bacterium]|nr:hypothetical protein [Clostridia bacterium]